MALTEVLKIVAEDKASHVIAGIANRAQYQFGMTAQASQKFAKNLSGYVTESIVGLGRTAIASFAAMGAAAVAGFGVLTVSSTKAYVESERLKTSITGIRQPVVRAVDDMEAAWHRLQVSIGKSVSESLKLPSAIDKIARATSMLAEEGGSGPRGTLTPGEASARSAAEKAVSQPTGVWERIGSSIADGFEQGIGFNLPDFMGGGGIELYQGRKGKEINASEFNLNAGGLLTYERSIRREQQLKRRAATESLDGNGGKDPLSKKAAADAIARFKETEDERRRAAEERKRRMEEEAREQEAAETEFNEHRERLSQLRAEREQSQYEERKKALDDEREQRRKDEEAAKKAAEDQQRIAEQTARMANSVGASIGGMLQKITQEGMSAADVLFAVLGAGVQIAGTLLAPGAGAVANGAIGFLGSLFSSGGVARAANGMRVPGVGSGDRVPALLERGETIIPAGASHPSFIEEVAAAANGGGGNTNVYLSQSYLVPQDSVTAQRTYQKGLVPVLQDLKSTGRGDVTNPRFRGTAGGRKRG